MELNPECIRALLLTVEKECNLEIGDSLCITQQNTAIHYQKLNEFYSDSQVFYHANQCIDNRLLKGINQGNSLIHIYDLTPQGHEFLANTFIFYCK